MLKERVYYCSHVIKKEEPPWTDEKCYETTAVNNRLYHELQALKISFTKSNCAEHNERWQTIECLEKFRRDSKLNFDSCIADNLETFAIECLENDRTRENIVSVNLI